MHQERIEVEKELLDGLDRSEAQKNVTNTDEQNVVKLSRITRTRRKISSTMNVFFRKWGILITFLIIFEIIMFTIRNFLTGTRHAQFHRLQEVSTALIFMGLGCGLIWKRLTVLTLKWPSLYREIFKFVLAIFLISSVSIWLFYYIYVPDGSIIVDFCFLCFAVFMHLGIFLFFTTVFEKLIDLILPNVELEILKSRKIHTIFCLALSITLVVIGFIAVATPPTVKSVDVTIKNLPKELDKFSISLITDVHIGPSVGSKRVQQIVDISNSLRPDVVAVVGDTVDGFLGYLKERALPLKNLKAKYGAYAVTGNHEYYHSDINKWIDFFEAQLNLTVLRNENRLLGKDLSPNGGVCLAGVDDYYTRNIFITGHLMDPTKALSTCTKNSTTVLLVHQPQAAVKIMEEEKFKIDLILSGHTHAGGLYITIPLARSLVKYLHGLYRDALTGTQIYVSAGINYWGPAVKMIDLCEITLIRLRSD